MDGRTSIVAHRALRLIAVVTTLWSVPSVASLADYVDPTIGVRGEGACMPGPCLPHSSIYPSPNTHSADNGGYSPSRDIVGFAQLHTQGTGGTPSYGNLLLSPQIGIAVNEVDHASPKANEKARAYSYEVRLQRYGIDCAVTPSHHSALYRFRFPSSDKATVSLELGRKVNGGSVISKGAISIDTNKGVIEGTAELSKNWCDSKYLLHVVGEFSRPPARVGTWKNTSLSTAASATLSDVNKPFGGYVQFDTQEGTEILCRLAVSFTSVDQARSWLRAEIPDWDFQALEARARSAWDDALGALTVDGGSDAEKRKFYTAMFHAMVQPRDRTGDFARYGGDPLWDDHYTMWDTWRTVFPLMVLVRPSMVAGVVNSFASRQSVLPQVVASLPLNPKVEVAFTQGAECRRGQGGDEADNIIADAFVKSIPGIDWGRAYEVMVRDAEYGRSKGYRELGYLYHGESNGDWRTGSGSSTPAFAYNDFCVAEVAHGLGKGTDAARYLERSGNWENVWQASASSDGFTGFIVPRNQDGSFASVDLTSNTSRRGYYEGGGWIYSYLVPHQVKRLIDRMGGKERFVERLEHALTKGYIDFSNEPSFLTIRLFNYAGRPDLCSKWVRVFMKRFTDTGYPGDEDAGAMGSMYAFCAAGFFPNAGQPVYLLNGPLHETTVLQTPGSTRFTIRAANAGESNPYVQSATLNGEPLNRSWISHQEIVDGGELAFVMGSSPSTWAHDGPVPPEGLWDATAARSATAMARGSTTSRLSTCVLPGHVLIRLPQQARGTLTVHDAGGKSVAVESVDATVSPHVRLRGFASGWYVARLTAGSARGTARFVVSH